MQYKPGICAFCGTGCGNFIKIGENGVNGIFSSQNHPVSKGRLCIRGWNLHELLNTPERITKPLKRNSGRLEETTYEDAIAILTERLSILKKDAAHSIGFLASARSSNEENYLLMKLARSVFKTNNISLGTEASHRNALNVLHYGTGTAGMSGSLEEIHRAEYLLVVDFDVTKQNPVIGSEIFLTAQAGAQLVTIDSRKTQIAKQSTRFLQPKPGAIKMVIALLAKSIIEKGLIDKDFIDNHTEGFNEFENSLKILEGIDIITTTGIPKEVIEETAAGLARAGTAMAFFPSGISGLDEDTISYLFNLFLITGKIGKTGCGINPITGINNLQGSYDMGIAPDLLTGFQPLKDRLAFEKFTGAWQSMMNTCPGYEIYDLLENDHSALKALFVVDHDDGIIRHADRIKDIEFVIYAGAYRNQFMEYADLVLPIASCIEEDGTFTNTERRVQLSIKKIEPPAGVLPGWRLYSRIAGQSGIDWGYASPGDIMKEVAGLTPSYSGICYEKLANTFGIQWPCNEDNPGGTRSFRLESKHGKLKFIFFKGVFHNPEANESLPFLLRIGKSRNYWHKNNLMQKTSIPKREYDAILMLYPEGYVEMFTSDAGKIGVRDGWVVRIVTKFGYMRAVVMCSDNILPDTAYIECFNDEELNALLGDHTDLLSRDEDTIIPVRIEKI